MGNHINDWPPITENSADALAECFRNESDMTLVCLNKSDDIMDIIEYRENVLRIKNVRDYNRFRYELIWKELTDESKDYWIDLYEKMRESTHDC